MAQVENIMPPASLDWRRLTCVFVMLSTFCLSAIANFPVHLLGELEERSEITIAQELQCTILSVIPCSSGKSKGVPFASWVSCDI